MQMQKIERRPGKKPAGFREIDIGCGPNKKDGALGIDCYPYSEVNVLCNLDHTPWPLKDNQFEVVYANHIIEHVASVPDFMRQIHRICRNESIVHIVTPHFSSLDSWKDPTHRRHLSLHWYEPFCRRDNYLAHQLPGFESINSSVEFSSSLRNLWPRFLYRILGHQAWEKHYAFRYPAKNIYTQLRVIK